MTRAARPRVLVTTGAAQRTTGLIRIDMVTGRNYADALMQVGCLPTFTASLSPDREAIEALIDAVDGVVLSGGADIDPARYGAAPDPGLGLVDDVRDAFELEMYAAARRMHRPLLGICRGIQTAVVAEGGSLHQHLPALPGTVQHGQQNPNGTPHHRVRMDPDSALARSFGGDVSKVNSYHHQGIDRLPESLRAVAWSDDDLVEAVEARSGAFMLAVQWHPEMAFERHPDQIAPFAAFAEALGVDR